MPVDAALAALKAGLGAAPAMLLQVTRTQGSTPREAGAWMAVWADGASVGSIGGGHLEFDAVQRAQRLLADGADADAWRVALGPGLGQCCGGVVWLQARRVDVGEADRLARELAPPRRPVALFGAGHVGQALVRQLMLLPVALRWIDSRDGWLPEPPPAGLACEWSDPPESAVAGLAPGSTVLVMTHSHAQDLAIVAAALARRRDRGDLGRIGLIGSRSKWVAFRSRLAARGFDDGALAAVCCPVGIAGLRGKAPPVVALSVAAWLMQDEPTGDDA